MSRLAFIAAIGLLLAGCAAQSAHPTITPYTTPETEADRAACLERGGLWIETQAQYRCAPPTRPGAPV